MNSKERHELRYMRRKAAREAKRQEKLGQYSDFDKVVSVSALVHAHTESRKGTLWKSSVSRYDLNYLKNSVRYSELLKNMKYNPEGFYEFNIVERGKTRNIHSLHYSERVIRRSLCTNCLVPILSNGLIYDNGASLKNKGISFAKERIIKHLHDFYRETGSNEGYILLVDFSGYFDHIIHEELFKTLSKISDPRLRFLCKKFISSSGKNGVGLFIGPEDSQIYAVSYHNSIDHYIKEILRVRQYIIYMDDSYLMDKSKEGLIKKRDILFEKYREKGIVPNIKKTQIVKISHGFTFLKNRYYLQDNGRVVVTVDRSSVIRHRRKLRKFKKFYERGEMKLEGIIQSHMSWRGHIKDENSFNIMNSVDDLFFSLFNIKPWLDCKNKKKGRLCYG